MAETELSKGLNPAPPNLSREPVDAAEAFWVIKHGIKASGMPAWGMSMQDEYIWGMVAFLQELPKLSPAQYQAMVASSGGHSHGGGETETDAAAGAMPDEHAGMSMEGMSGNKQSAPEMIEHRHADGTVESHPAPQPEKADDGHDHEH